MPPLRTVHAEGIEQSGSLRVALCVYETARLSVSLYFIYTSLESVD